MLKLIWLMPMLAMLLYAAIEDVRTRRIRNWLTLAIALSGICLSFSASGLHVAPSQSGLGLLVGFGVPFILFALGALGGGDVKLLAGIGAWVGPLAVVQIFLGAALVGLIIVLVQCAARGKLAELFRNSAVLAMSFVHASQLGVAHAREMGQSCRTVDRPLPYAVPVFVATIIVVTTAM